MADELEWAAEVIPDTDSVFMRAHRSHFWNGELGPGVFRKQGEGMSVDWARYASPQATKSRGKTPNDNAVIIMPVLGIRQIRDLTVEHTPNRQQANRAHSDVYGLPEGGEELTEVRVLLRRIADIAIPLTNP